MANRVTPGPPDLAGCQKRGSLAQKPFVTGLPRPYLLGKPSKVTNQLMDVHRAVLYQERLHSGVNDYLLLEDILKVIREQV